jgi:hypothetical protein
MSEQEKKALRDKLLELSEAYPIHGFSTKYRRHCPHPLVAPAQPANRSTFQRFLSVRPFEVNEPLFIQLHMFNRVAAKSVGDVEASVCGLNDGGIRIFARVGLQGQG